jgi:hypothetical protein
VTEDQLPPGGIEIGDDPPWEAWRPADVARLLAGAPATWFVAGGWALDLYRGAQAREHGDLEIAVPAGDDTFGPIRQALAAYEFEVVGAGRSSPGQRGRRPAASDLGAGAPGGVYRLDIFREPHDDDIWICRRDEAIRFAV